MEQYQNVEEEKLIIWLLVCPVKRERGNNKKGSNVRGSLEMVSLFTGMRESSTDYFINTAYQ